jgi:murein hydrolase activator
MLSLRLSHRDIGQRVASFPVMLLSAGLAGGSVESAGAQTAPAPQQQEAAAPATDLIRQREQELEAAREQQKKAAELQAKLKADIAAIGQDRGKLNQQLIDIAARVRGVEAKIEDAEARLRPLDSREREIRTSLDSRRGEIAEVLAAKMPCNRCGRRCCWAPWYRTCERAPKNSSPILANS